MRGIVLVCLMVAVIECAVQIDISKKSPSTTTTPLPTTEGNATEAPTVNGNATSAPTVTTTTTLSPQTTKATTTTTTTTITIATTTTTTKPTTPPTTAPNTSLVDDLLNRELRRNRIPENYYCPCDLKVASIPSPLSRFETNPNPISDEYL